MYAEANRGYLWEWGSWEGQWKPYYMDDKLLLCPRTIEEGARPPFHANTEEGTRMSYAPNFWTPTLAPDDDDGANNQVKAMLWQTAEHKGNTRIPMFGDAGNHGAMPMLEDEPPEYDGQYHPSNSGGGGNELWRFCMSRHNGYTNMLFLDYSVRKVGLKGLWKLWWGKPWRDDPPLEPVWPEWMQGMSDEY
jgi:prepilin-type processing-associated H-X9-DG protein